MSEALLEQRIVRLEDDSREFRDDLKQIRGDLSYIRGRIEMLPTWVMLSRIIGGQIALAGVLIVASRLLGRQ